MKRFWFLAFLALAGCGDAFSLVCDAAGFGVIETGPAEYPSSSAIVPAPLPPRSTRPAPGAGRSR